MLNLNGLLRFVLLAAVAFSTVATRGYNSAHFAQQAPVSGMARYLAASCCETDTAAVLARRTDPVRQLHLYSRRLSVAHGTACVRTTETNSLFSIAAVGVLPFNQAVPITPHTLFSLSCLLTI